MDLEILSCWAAKDFRPKVRTAAMRIYSGNPMENMEYGRLRRSKLWVAKFKYVFDDIHCMSGEYMDDASKDGPLDNIDVVFMSRKIARQIVRDFVLVRNEIECLMVHCKMGEGRSAAVGMALNEGFKLGDDTFRLSEEFPSFNTGVYELVLEAAEKT